MESYSKKLVNQKIIKINDLMNKFKFLDKLKEIEKIKKELSTINDWNSEKYKNLISTLKNQKIEMGPLINISLEMEDLKELITLEEMSEYDLGLISKKCDEIEENIKKIQILQIFKDPLELGNCFLTISSGAGGVESCDWVEILSRMYFRWISIYKKWNYEIISFSKHEITGYKNITVKVIGKYAFGFCKAEQGVHRLIRNSSFDKKKKRHTTFAVVEISPEVTENIDINIKNSDIEIQKFRCSGPGGQNVNKVETGVRIIHKEYSLVSISQSQRSQKQNLNIALSILKSKLYIAKKYEQDNKVKSIVGTIKNASWGNQTRTYVLTPYTKIKDERTNFKISDTKKVLDGDIDSFIFEFLSSYNQK